MPVTCIFPNYSPGVLKRLIFPILLAGIASLGLFFSFPLEGLHLAVAAGPFRYVAPGGNCGGSTPCYATIQAAVNAAAANDEILVATGLYTGVTFTAGTTQTVYINKAVTLRGGYTITNWTAHDPALYPTIVDAQGLGRVIYIDSASPTLMGFEIRNGNSSSDGGGIYLSNSDAIIQANRIYSNTANNLGAGIYNIDGSPRLVRNRIYNNIANFGGGGFANITGSPTTQNNFFYNNRSGRGAGLAHNDLNSPLILENDTFYGNIADTSSLGGGGILNGGPLIATNIIVFSNTASIGGAGGIANVFGGTSTIDHSIVFGNTNPDTTGPVTITNAVNADPLFVNPATGDFHLQTGSPAREAGTTLAGVLDDIDGHGRPFGADFDIGADEVTDVSGTCFARLDNGRVYTNVQLAADDSVDGSLIQVAGRCAGTSLRDGLNQVLYTDHTLTVQGGYTVTDWVEPRYQPTILDANNGGRGIYVTGTTDIVLESLHVTGGNIANSGGGGIFLGNDGNSTLRNNVIYRNQAIVPGDGGGIYVGSLGTTVLQHNTVFSNTAQFGGGIYASGSSGPVSLANTIVANNMATTQGGGIHDVAGGNVTLSYNNFYQNNPTDYNGVSAGATDISVPPGFQNVGAGDFHLDVNSSGVINRADPASPVTTDYENEARPQGSRADIGADESRTYAEVVINDLTLPVNPRVVTDTTLIQGTFITFPHTISNLSQLGSPTTFDVTTSNSDGWTVTLIGITSPIVLTDTESVSFDVQVSVPGSVPLALFNRTLITVTSQANPNVFDTTTDVIANPSLELAPSYTVNADPGDVLTFTHTLTNTGPITDVYNVSLNSPLGWGTLVAPTAPVTVAPGLTVPVVVQVAVVDTAPANLADVITVTAASLTFGISARVTDTVTANAVPGDRYVATVGNNFNNNCTQEDTPCATVSHAVNQTVFSDTVFVAQGFYNDADINIVLKIDVRGGYLFSGGEFNLPPGGIDPSTTVINAAGGRGFNLNVASVFRPEINGFTIQNASPSGIGGGFFLQSNSSPLLRNLIIRQSAATRGAGIYVDAGSPTLDNVIIDGTTASDRGGGIYINTGSPRFNQVAISNTVASQGGAIYLGGGSPLITNTTIYSSIAGSGGGIYQNGGNLTAYKLKISESRATSLGGGLYRAAGTATISQTQVASSTAPSGGGIYNAGGTLNLWNSFVFSNTATSGGGGGLYNGAGLSAINDTFYGNQASVSGGAIFDNNSLNLAVSNTIIAFNSAGSGGGIARSGGAGLSLSYNNAFNNSGGNYSGLGAGANSISADPRFASTDPADLTFLRLLFDSPSVDTASPTTFLARDIEDDIRPVNQGFDMGADEVSGCLARLVRTDTVYGVLQEAIDDAIDSDVIQVTGICRGVLPRLVGTQTLSQTALITKNLNIEGGYDASFNPSPELAILDAQNAGRTMVITGSTISVRLTNLHLTGGRATGPGLPGIGNAGGGLYSHDVLLEMVGSVISGNQATYGGGLYALNGRLTLGGDDPLEASQFISNTATFGGGLYLQGVSPFTGEGLTFQQNSAGQDGGGLYHAVGSTGTLSRTNLFSNTASANGGGLFSNGGLLTAQVITAAYNSATSGAGVYNSAAGLMDLHRSVVMSNNATSGGGIFNASSNLMNLVNTLVVSNTASGNGAGLYNTGSSLEARHNTFFGNDAGGQGGGIYYNTGTPPLINSTLLVDNSAGSGGGIFSTINADSNFRYNDVSGNNPDDYGGMADPTGANGNISQSVQFLSLDPANPDFLRLPGGSPAEDQGDPASPIIVDIEEDPRPSNQNPDIGADEVSNCFVRINGLPPTYGNIQVAINQSQSGDEIRVAGLCQGVNPFVDNGQPVNQTAFLTKSLTIYGGYTPADWVNRDPVANPTTLDALSLGRVVYITNSARITIDGLRLGYGSGTNGGGVFVGTGALTMTNSRIYSSSATNGGALYNVAGTVHLFDDNQVYSNTATSGAGFYNAGGTFTLEDNLIRGNNATSRGGAFFHAGGTSWLQNNIIWGNSATSEGGAVYNSGTNLTVWHNTFVANSSPSGAGFFTTLAANVDLRNNIFHNHTGTSVVHSAPVAFTVTYNNIFPASPGLGGSASAGTGLINVDPGFQNAPAGDFHLLDTSLVVDKGDPAVTLFLDFDDDTIPRDLRPGGQGFDLGADEIPGCRARIVREPAIIYGNIQLAIDHSIPGDTIQVTADRACGGVHPFNVGGGKIISQTAHITHNLTLVGGFNFDFTPNPNVQTLINPLALGRAVLVTGTTQVTMSNFFLQNGKATGLSGGPGNGDAGGGFYYSGVGGLLNNITIYSGTAAFGGGLFSRGSGLSITNSSIWTNTATANGGGIYNSTGTLGMLRVELEDNLAAGNGGGLYNDTGLMQLDGNDIFDNRAANGAGLYNNNSASVLDRGNRFHDNLATSDGGGLFTNNGNMLIQNNFFYENRTNDEGGAIYVNAGSPTIRHNTFYDNDGTQGSSRGGAIYINSSGTPSIQNNIFDSNDASGGGSAIFKAAPNLAASPNAYWPTNAGVQVLGITLSGTNPNVNPQFVDAANGNFHLLGISLLVDNGAADDSLGLDYDFENNPRPVNLHVEMGADEYSDCLAQVVASGIIYGRIQEALDAAPSAGEVRVATGTCLENIDIVKAVTLSGRWNPDFLAQNLNTRTVIDADDNDRVVNVGPVTTTVNLSYLNLTNGSTGGNGGGLLNQAQTLNLSSMEIYANEANNGGGIYHAAGTLSVNGIITDNTASGGDGGGIYVASTSPTSVFDATIDNNQALGGNGGAVYNGPNSDVDINGGSMSGNSAGINGGAVYNAPGSTVVIGGGGPIALNQATTHGGGIYNDSATLTLDQKRVSLNQAKRGGGIYLTGTGQLRSQNLGLFGNQATDTTNGNGAGLYREGGGTANIYHATIHTNVANNLGGGIYNASGSMVVSATILAFNIAPDGGSAINGVSPVNVNYSLRETSNSYAGVILGGVNLQDVDPRLREPGGDLEFDSPAIDAVPVAASGVTIDRYGNTREIFPDRICQKDMGRDEFNVRRNMTWLPVNNPTPPEALIAPTESTTYTFFLRNDSENLTTDAYTSLGLGTGYTETVTVTLNSTQGWAEFIEDPVLGIISGTTTATFDLGPGVTANLQVRVTVPPGQTATETVADEPKDLTSITYVAELCAGQPTLSATSSPAVTRVEANRSVLFEADEVGGPLLPGQTLTFTHIVTNTGNITDTYIIAPGALLYTLGEVLDPPNSRVENLAPGLSRTVVVSVTINPAAAGGLIGRANFLAISENDVLIQDEVVDTIPISFTSGTRHVSLSGQDALDTGTEVKSNNCTQPQLAACRTIQHALSEAAPGDLIKIEQGVYGVVFTDVLTVTHQSQLITQVAFIDKSITLQGGYNRQVDPDWSDNPPNHVSYTTTLDPQDLGRAIYIATTEPVTIDRLSLRNGDAAGFGPGGQDDGGLIYNEGANLTLHANRLYDGDADRGGALYSDDGDLLLQNNMLNGNTATTGGAVYVAAGQATLENNTFYDNQAGNGGALYVDDGNLLVTNTIFADNNNHAVSVAGSVVRTLDYNLYNGNTPADFAVNGSTTALPGANDRFGPPQFADLGATPPDLHLTTSSDARDTASPATLLNIDYDNEPRPLPLVGSFDIGADEFLPLPGLNFYSSTFTSTVAPSQVIITHFLENTGDVTDTYTITASSTQPWGIDFDQPLPYTITLTPGLSQTVVVTYNVPAGANGLTNLTTITATASLTSVFAAVADEIQVRSAAWEISKQVEPSNAIQPGGTLTYTIIITNVGDLNTGTAIYTISDELPAYTNFVSGTPTPDSIGPVVQWITNTDLITGASLSFQYVVTVTQPLTDGLPIVNDTYSVSGAGAPEVFGAPVTVTVEAGAILSAIKTASSSPVQAGDYLTYTITLTNAAGALAPAFDIVITDTLPGQVVYQAMGFAAGTAGITSAVGSDLAWQLTDPLQPGTSVQLTATVRVLSPLAAGTLLTNTFGITSTSIDALIVGSVTTPVTSTNIISLSKSADPVNVVNGGAVTYTITLTNSGNGVATVSLTDTLHPDFNPATYLNTVIVPGRSWVADGVTTVSFTATVPITGGAYLNPLVTATFEITELVLVDTAPITVEGPVVDLTLVNDSPTILGQLTTLTSSITAGNNVSYVLDFGDNSGMVTGVLTPNIALSATHTYPAGIFIAVITATNNVSTQVATTTVIIEEPITGLTLVNDSPTLLGQSTLLTASITAGTNVTYTLDFGDGSPFVVDILPVGVPLPFSHLYGSTGLFTATITATNHVSTEVATTTVQVVTSPPRLLAPPNGTITRTQAITFSWTDTGVPGYTIDLDGTLTGVSTEFSATILAEGVHTWTVASVDAQGQQSVFTDVWSITVDVTPPTVPVPISPLTGSVQITNAVSLQWGASTDTLSGVVSYTVIITRSGGTTVTTVGNVTSLDLILADGVYIWTVQAIDAAGNQSSFSSPQQFRVDTQPPVKPVLISPPDGTLTNTANVDLVWSQVSPVVTYTVYLNGDPFLLPDPLADPVVSATVLADGVYTWTVEATDGLGRSSGVTDTWTFTVDATAPTVPAPISPTSGQTVLTSTVPFSWGASTDALSGVVSYTLVITGPGGTTTVNLGNVTSTNQLLTPDGDYTWAIEAIDAAGNHSGFSAPITFSVDATGPDRPVLIAPPNGTITTSQAITLEWSSVVQAVTYTVHLNGDTFDLTPGAVATVISPTNLPEGVYTWSVEAIDSFGRSSGLTDTWVFTIDLTAPPLPALIAPPDGSITRTNPLTFRWTDVEPEASYNLQLNSGGSTTLQGPFSTNQALINLPFGDGVYTWTVEAVDQAGNSSGFTSTWTVTLDTTPPTAPTLLTPANGAVFTQSGVITFSWTPANDLLSGPVVYTLNIGGQPPVILSGTSQVVTITTDGVYTWSVTAADQLGNAVTAGPQMFEVDLTPPAPVRLLAPPNGTITRTANITFDWTDVTDTGLLTYTLLLTEPAGSLQSFATFGSSQNVTLSGGDGFYTWTVRVDDRFGRSSLTDTWTLLLDTTPPTSPTLINPANGTVFTQTNVITFEWGSSVDNLLPLSYTLSISGQPLQVLSTTSQVVTMPEGVFTWTVWAIDLAGNRAFTETWSFAVDNNPPDKPRLISPPDQTFTNNPNVIFTWTPVTDTITYTLNLNGNLFPVTAPATARAFAGLAEGVYTWTVQAEDIYNRTLGYTDTWRLVVDLTPPTTPTLISPAHNAVISDTARPVFDWADSTDALSGPVTYTVTITDSNGVVTTTVVSSSNFTPGSDLPVGVYTWSVQAFDLAGNSSISGPFSFTIQAPTSSMYLPVLLNSFGETPPPPPPNRPDLVIDSLTLIPKTGNTYTVRVVARNQSATPVTFGNNFYVNVYLDGNTANPAIVWGVQASWFGANQSRTLEQDYTFSSGAHTLRAWADPFDTVVESDETNNTRDTSLTVAGAGQQAVPPSNPRYSPGPQPTPTTIPGSR